MPLLYHGHHFRSRLSTIISPTWWRQKIIKLTGKGDHDINNNTTTATTTTRDWRSLSPNNPPLPLVLENDHSITKSDSLPLSQTTERSPKRLPIPNSYRRSFDDPHLRKLSTIIEESDLLTEISISPRSSTSYHRYRQHHRHQEQIPTHPQHDKDKNNDITVVPSPPLPPNDTSHPSTSSSSTSSSSGTSSSSSSSSTSSTNSFQPPPSWPIHPKTESRWSSSPSLLPISEKKAKRKFIKMIQAAYRFRQENKQDMPSEMEILFDSKDNIQRLRLWIHDKIQYHTFKGDAQYIPPELSNRRTYHCDLVDVWVLGISLYRMLVGKYPFHANNDRRLFNKMQHADFGIPSHLSSDAKDLLRRMLAPDHSRASLDLVMFHPWLKPYTVVISNNNDKSSSSSIITPSRVVPSTSLPTPLWHPSTSTSYHINTSRRKKSLVSHLTKVMVFIIEGPYPPPRQPYRDLSPTIRF